MQAQKIHEIPGILLMEWSGEIKTTFDTWSSYGINVPQFREAILEKGVRNAKANGGQAWVMDATKARGAFSPEVKKLIETEVFKAFAAIGIKYFITIKSASAITNLSINGYTRFLGPCGIQMVEVPDRDKAVAWMKEQL